MRAWSGLVILSLILSLSSCLETPQAKELLDNPSFEDGLSGWSADKNGEATIKEIEGNKVLFLSNSSVSQWVDVKEGETLCLSCAVYDLSFGEDKPLPMIFKPFAMISFYDKNGNFLTNRRTYQYVRGTWFNASISFETPKGSSFAIIDLEGSERSYFDNVSLIRSSKKPSETFYSIKKEYDLFVGVPWWHSLPESDITLEERESNRLHIRSEEECHCSQPIYSESNKKVTLNANIDLIDGEAGVIVNGKKITAFPQLVDLVEGWNDVTLFVIGGEAYFDDISLGDFLKNLDFENRTLSFEAYFNIPIDFWNQRFTGIGDITVEGADLIDAEVTKVVGNYTLPGPNHLLRMEIESSVLSNITLSFESNCIVSGASYGDSYYEEEKYLVATETIQANHPYIVENATALGDLRSIVDFVGNLNTFYSPEQKQDALSTLLNGGDMCVGTSRLECALFRAKDIPSRAIYVYMPNFSPTHWVCEAYRDREWIRIEQDTKQCPMILQGSVVMLSLEPEMENVRGIELWQGDWPVMSIAGCTYEGFSNPCIYYEGWGGPPKTDYMAIDIDTQM